MAEEFAPYSVTKKRDVRIARSGEPELGPLKLLPGTWANIRPEHRMKTKEHPDGDPFKGDGTLQGQGQSPFDGRGWNLIALPFAEAGQFRNYRLLMNQYNEVLNFAFVDDKVPNRGITADRPADNADQEIAALDYTQMIKQIAAADVSDSGLAGDPELPIHHEPGFFLHMKEQQIENIDIARLATIPHGNAATALGRAVEDQSGPPTIRDLSGFPEGVSNDIVQAVDDATDSTDYLFPYNQFTVNPFKGVITAPGFPGFGPANANNLLQIGLPQNVVKTTTLSLDTELMEGGIVNIPFIERQADAASMKSIFWIMELDEKNDKGDPRLVLAYSQFIYLDFFPRPDGKPGLIRWPHISINVMEKIEEPSADGYSRAVMAQA
jgi:hypothetical protein